MIKNSQQNNNRSIFLFTDLLKKKKINYSQQTKHNIVYVVHWFF